MPSLKTSEQVHNVVIHLEDKIYINFADQKLSLLDQDTGEIIPVEVSVAILPHLRGGSSKPEEGKPYFSV